MKQKKTHCKNKIGNIKNMKIYQNFKEQKQGKTPQDKGDGGYFINPLSPSYQWGIGCFTTTRTINGKIFELSQHLKRLESNLKEIQSYGFLEEIKFDKSEVEKFLSRGEFIFTESQNLANTKTEFKIKIMLTEDGLFIIIDDLKINQTKIDNGIVCKTLKLKRNFPKIKSTSYQESIFASQIAHGNLNCDEIIFEDDLGNLLEANFSNLFWIKNNQIFRSPKNLVLEGVTQKLIQKIDPQIQEDFFKKEELENGKIQAAFLTKSTTLIESIKQINQTKLNPKHPKIKELKKQIKEYLQKN